MNNIAQKYQSVMGQVNYALFLVIVALLPFPQIFLRYACTAWLICWLLEGRFLTKPNKEDWRKMMPFLMFGGWYIWKIVSGLWADDLRAYNWQLERYMMFGAMIPIGIWGLNAHYNWKQICKVLAISCVAAAIIYAFTLYWVLNARTFSLSNTLPFRPLTFEVFADKISHIKHRLFLCSVEMMGVMALLYTRKDIIQKYGKIVGGGLIIIAIAIMVSFIIATGSRASIISGVALISIWLLYQLPIRHIRYKIALVVFACGIGLFALSQHPRMQEFNYARLFSIHEVEKGDNVRLNIWGLALEAPQDYSLYGLGAGQSTPYLQAKYTEAGLHQYNKRSYATHNQYLEEWIEIGIPGMLFFVLAWISIPLFNTKRGRKSAVILLTLYALNMLTDCMFGRYDGIILWCVWMVLIRLQSDTESHQQTTGDAQ